MMFATIESGVITGLFGCPQPFGTTQVPDDAGIGYVLSNGQWQKGPDLIDHETDEIARDGRKVKFKTALAVVEQYEADAQTAYDDWPNKTPAQKDVVMRETVKRFGVIAGRLVDCIKGLRLDK